MKRIPFLAFSMLCAFSLQANPANPQISNVEVSSSLGSLQVKYDLDEDAVVTMEVLVNDVAIEDDKVTTLEGAVNRKVAAGVEQTIVWKAYKDWPDQTVEANALSVRLTAWAPARPPDYMVIDLRATAPAPRIRYYASAGGNVDFILEGVNKYLMALAKEQIKLAFQQSEKEVEDLHQRTREGMETARLNGKQIGQKEGAKLTTKKSIASKEIIMKHSKDFNGTLADADVMTLTGLARNTYYKYKKELKEEVI